MSVCEEIFSLLAKRAERDYQEALQAWKQKLEDEQARFNVSLRNPSSNRALGLPESLPEETIKILKFTQALDKVGPLKPHPKRYYDRWGVPVHP